jgi:hypothetical protein
MRPRAKDKIETMEGDTRTKKEVQNDREDRLQGLRIA